MTDVILWRRIDLPAVRSAGSSVAMIAGSYLQRSRVHHSVAIIAW
jgi:hypothetical protein